jgi:ligand-binding SRPBCC domain-containing protein
MSASVAVERAGGGYRLSADMVVPNAIEDVFAFFAEPENLEAITPPWLRFRVLRAAPPEVGEGTLIDYRLRLHGLPLRWRSAIRAWDPPRGFVDEQVRGPYRAWHHEHAFREVDGGTAVRDRVAFALPRGGRLVAAFVARDLRSIFRHRQRVLAARFAG